MPDLKVIEKSRKLLIQVMGQEDFDKFIEDGKIEIKHKDITYELDQDARVYNRTNNQSYCIEPICSDNLPVHDQLAIKYGYLKHNIDRVEKVANKRNLSGYEQTYRLRETQELRYPGTGDVTYIQNTPQPSQRPDYGTYVEYMESLGWRRNKIDLNEKYTNFVTINDLEARINGIAIDIRVPPGHMMSIIGTQQAPDARIAHVLKVKLADKDECEIPFDTRIRIIKSYLPDSYRQLAFPFYGEINILINNENPNQLLFKTNEQFYKFTDGIEFNGGEHLLIEVDNCERDICAKYTKFSLECDFWSL